MSYKIVSVSNTLHVVRPKRWWNTVSFKDLVAALSELKDIVSVVKFWDGQDTKYIVITGRSEAQG